MDSTRLRHRLITLDATLPVVGRNHKAAMLAGCLPGRIRLLGGLLRLKTKEGISEIPRWTYARLQ